MAQPDLNSSLKVFLENDLFRTSNHLALAKDSIGKPYLVMLSKKDTKKIKEKKACFSLIKIVNFIQKNQKTWLQQTTDQRARLEHQLAILERKVIKYNHIQQKHVISYKNPCRWKIDVRIIFPKTFEANYKNQILSKELHRYFSYDRLSSHNSVYQNCKKICNSKFSLEVYCNKTRCEAIHKIQVKPSLLFKKLHFDDFIPKDSDEHFILPNEAGKNRTITIEAFEGNLPLLEKLLNSIHQTDESGNQSDNTYYLDQPIPKQYLNQPPIGEF